MNQRVTLALLLSICTLMPALGQTRPTDDKDDVVRITTNLVQVDVSVTKDGKPVTNLSADDFELYEDGKRQPITSFAYISNVASSASAAANNSAPAVKTDTNVPPVAIQRDVPRRTIAIVVDDLGLSAQSMNQVRRQLQKFIAEELQPNDLVAVIRTGGQMGALQQFTNDKRLLTRAVDRLRWNQCGRLGFAVFTPVEGVQQLSCYQNPISITLRALRFILNSMAQLPGRKSMILLSDSIPLKKEDVPTAGIPAISDTATVGMKSDSFDPQTVGGDVTNYGGPIQRLAETAIRASVVIYSVDTQGLLYNGIAATDSVSGSLPQKIPEFNRISTNRSQEMLMNREASEELAKRTGGYQVHNSNDFQLDRIVDQERGYYLLGYRPTDATFNRQFHQLKAKVKRSGLTLRTRSGFFGVTQDEANRARPATQDQTNLALASPFAAQDLELDLTSFFTNGNTEGAVVRSFLYLNPANLSFVPNNGHHETALEVHGVIFGDNGSIVEKVKHDIILSLGENEYQQAMRDGLPDAVRLRFDMPAKKPGSYQVRIAVRDRTSAKIGSAGQFVDVPDLTNKRVALSGIVLRGSSAATATAAVMATPPGHRFQPNSDLNFALFVYNPTPNLVLQTKLFRDGKVVKTGTETPIDVTNNADAARVLTSGVFHLMPDLEPGDYNLQVVVTDKNGKQKQSVTQWMAFEITK